MERHEMAGRHVVDVHDVEPGVDVRRHPPGRGIENHLPGGSRLDVSRPDRESRG